MVELDETVRLPLTRQQSTMGSGIVFPVCGLASKQHLQRLLEGKEKTKKHRVNLNLTAAAAESVIFLKQLLLNSRKRIDILLTNHDPELV